MNHFSFSGRLTHDPELTTFNSGKQVARFSVAIDRRYQDADGAWQSDPTFIDCEVWEKKAQTLADRYKKGSFILVTDSSIKTDRWEDKATGAKRSKLMFRVNHYEPLPLLNPVAGGQEEAAGAAEDQQAAAPPAQQTPPAKKGGTKAPASKKGAVTPTEDELVGAAAGGDDIPF